MKRIQLPALERQSYLQRLCFFGLLFVGAIMLFALCAILVLTLEGLFPYTSAVKVSMPIATLLVFVYYVAIAPSLRRSGLR